MLERFGRDPTEARVRLAHELSAFAALPEQLSDVWAVPLRPGAWSLAQTTEHVLRVNVSVSKVLRLLRQDAPPSQGNHTPLARVGGRVQAPAFSLPGPPRPWAALEGSWLEMTSRLQREAAASRVWQGRTWVHPFFGDLDALGWLASASFHMAHHRRQHCVS